jgi:hypothetical protein
MAFIDNGVRADLARSGIATRFLDRLISTQSINGLHWLHLLSKGLVVRGYKKSKGITFTARQMETAEPAPGGRRTSGFVHGVVGFRFVGDGGLNRAQGRDLTTERRIVGGR